MRNKCNYCGKYIEYPKRNNCGSKACLRLRDNQWYYLKGRNKRILLELCEICHEKLRKDYPIQFIKNDIFSLMELAKEKVAKDKQNEIEGEKK